MDLYATINLSLMLGASLGAALWLLPVRSIWARLFAVLILTFLTLYYASWRVTSLPGLALTFGSLWPWLFFGFEVVTLGYEFWTMWTMVWRTDHSPEADDYEQKLRSMPPGDLPTVDVFIATVTEPLDLLKQTILAAVSLEYPKDKLRVYVGDDGPGLHPLDGRSQDDGARPKAEFLESLVTSLGAIYVSRPDIIYVCRPGEKIEQDRKLGGNGKGGNDRFTFTLSEGDFILMLDADFSLERRFLYRVLGFFKFGRDDVALVQTPQRFHNWDPVAHNLRIGAYVPDEQHYFMSITQQSRDARRNAFCVGSGCVVARDKLRLLDTQWGFPHQTICEDFELSYALAGKGYRTLHLNEALAYGLAPESITQYLKQRMRWCRGTVGNLFISTGPFKSKSLRLIDRLFYLEGLFYWLGFIFIALLLVAPIIFWSTGVPLLLGSTDAALLALLPRLAARFVILHWLSEGKLPFIVLNVSKTLPAFRISFHVSWSLLAGVLRCLGFRVKEDLFDVTTKGGKLEKDKVYWPLFTWFAAIGVFTLVGMLGNLMAVYQVVQSGDMTCFNVAWSMSNCAICVFCCMASIDKVRAADDYLYDPKKVEVTRSNSARIAYGLLKYIVGISSLKLRTKRTANPATPIPTKG